MRDHQALPQDLHSTTLIRFQDCDPFGHLNNARYLDYFINARSDQLAAYYNFHIMEFGKQPTESWVSSKTQIAYLAPAVLAETVMIRTRLLDVGKQPKGTLLVEGVMLDAAEQRLKAVCWLEFTYINLKNGKPAIHSDDLMTFFEQVIFDETIPLHFDERVQGLKAAYRRQATLATAQPA